jgi:hypothetical protein
MARRHGAQEIDRFMVFLRHVKALPEAVWLRNG